ncbi:MAG: hypothetical protein HQL18_02125, partial [Candidatus Omnitrophica bacterium]|nr:hypothetical protein [Candidatus Omnitrophota bacterium]
LAGRQGIILDQVVPQKDVQRLISTDRNKKYYAVPVAMQARSGYRKFSGFLRSLEKEHVFWKVDAFSFVADAQYAQKNQIKFLVEVILLDE